MKVLEEVMPGLVLLKVFSHKDDRGEFVKTFNDDAFSRFGIPFAPKEIVFSISAKNVVRGMHFQVPPSDHHKLVSCSSGAILDVVVDLRKGSPSFGRHAAFNLNETNRHVLMIPRGFAHGFLALEERSLVAYATDTVHDPSSDSGIAWDGFGFEWPVESPVVSDKDRNLPALASFESPFVYQS